MKLKSLLSAAAFAGVLASAPAHALLVQDSWQLDLTAVGGSVTTGIGHLGLQSGSATVLQEVNGSGQVFVGAAFEEFGSIFSVNYTPNSVVGTGDSGLPAGLNLGAGFPGLQIAFTGLSGHVIAATPGGAFSYAFTPGVGSVTLSVAGGGPLLAEFAVVNPSNGSFNNNLGAAGAVGDSTLLSLVLPTNYTSNLFRDSGGNSFDPYVTGVFAGGLFLNVVTHNTIAPGAVTGPVACGFTTAVAGDLCLRATVTSDGPADLLRVPEPGSLALLGGALLGVYGFSRRRG